MSKHAIGVDDSAVPHRLRCVRIPHYRTVWHLCTPFRSRVGLSLVVLAFVMT